LTEKVVFEDTNALIYLCGQNDNTIKLVEKELGVEIFPKGNEFVIEADNENIVKDAKKALKLMYNEVKQGKDLESNDIKYLINQVISIENFNSDDIEKSNILVSKTGKLIKARNNTQYKYIKAIRKHDVSFSIGPAGTGKTYIAVALGINAIITGEKKRLILTRPVVEAGENLGFLPGDLQQKINPYLRPLFDALIDMLGFDEYQRYKEKEVIEVAPLAYMRGRTLNNAFIILDEAQNTTKSQMKMFLTRLGETSKVVVTGDVTQIDLPKMRDSGLLFAQKILRNIPEISFNLFSKMDVVRHPLVKMIIDAFEKHEK
jgi:phosphate starvation-inducible protein PhoH and related proteins